MRRFLMFGGLLAGAVGLVDWWRRHRRFGASYVNRVVDPWLVRRGLVANSGGELGLLELVGRRTGAIRVTPVHPVPTETGFRIVVPLAEESQWARNVLAAGRCRIQVGDVVHELDEPRLVTASQVGGLPAVARRVLDWLGVRYMLLRHSAQRPGRLDDSSAVLPMIGPAEGKAVAVA